LSIENVNKEQGMPGMTDRFGAMTPISGLLPAVTARHCIFVRFFRAERGGRATAAKDAAR
jgi:hypothetical protein